MGRLQDLEFVSSLLLFVNLDVRLVLWALVVVRSAPYVRTVKAWHWILTHNEPLSCVQNRHSPGLYVVGSGYLSATCECTALFYVH